jgi:hypothetical protein
MIPNKGIQKLEKRSEGARGKYFSRKGIYSMSKNTLFLKDYGIIVQLQDVPRC